MFRQDENDLDLGGPPDVAPTPQASDPIADLMRQQAELKKQQDEAQGKKAMLNVIGSIGQSLADRPSGYEIYTGKTSKRPDMKGMMSAAADSIQAPVDPMSQQEKAYAYLNAKRTNDSATEKDTFKNSLKDETSSAAKAFKQTLLSSGGDPEAINGSTAFDLYTQGYSPAKMAEIKAKSNVDFADKAKLFQMEQRERSKDKKDLKATQDQDKADSEYQKYVERMEGHAATLRGDDAAKLSSAKLSAIASGRALLKQYAGREDEMTPDQLSLLAADRVKAVTGGVPSVEEVRHMMPSNSGTTWAGIKSRFTNKPEAAHSGGWAKEAESDFAAQEKAARDILQNRQNQVLSNPKLKPEDRERIGRMAVPPEYNPVAAEPALDADLLKAEAQKEIERRRKNASNKAPGAGG